MDEGFTVISNCSDIKSTDFTLIKVFNNEKIVEEYNDGFEQVFQQMCLDIPRQDVYLDEAKVNHITDILNYISNQPYLKCDQVLVYLFLSQTMLSIPVMLLTQIIGNIDEELVVSNSDSEGRTVMILNSDTLLVQKKLTAVIPSFDKIETKLYFDVSIDVDFVFGETLLYIKGNNSL